MTGGTVPSRRVGSRPLWVADVEIAFVAPHSVAVLLHDAIAAFTRRARRLALRRAGAARRPVYE